MATYVRVPTFTEPYYDVGVAQDEKSYIFRFRALTREGTLLQSVLRADKIPLVEGVKLVPGIDLLAKYKYNTDLPQGVLVVLYNKDGDHPPDNEELGEGLRCELLYVVQ